MARNNFCQTESRVRKKGKKNENEIQRHTLWSLLIFRMYFDGRYCRTSANIYATILNSLKKDKSLVRILQSIWSQIRLNLSMKHFSDLCIQQAVGTARAGGEAPRQCLLCSGSRSSCAGDCCEHQPQQPLHPEQFAAAVSVCWGTTGQGQQQWMFSSGILSKKDKNDS